MAEHKVDEKLHQKYSHQDHNFFYFTFYEFVYFFRKLVWDKTHLVLEPQIIDHVLKMNLEKPQNHFFNHFLVYIFCCLTLTGFLVDSVKQKKNGCCYYYWYLITIPLKISAMFSTQNNCFSFTSILSKINVMD